MEELDYIPARTILSAYGEQAEWFGVNYNMNLYKGCSHGCIYCDSRSDCYGIKDFDRVRPKRDALDILGGELSRKRKGGVIGLGAMSDPYNPLERKLGLTGGALELIDRYRFGVALSTKSALVTRDRGIFRSIASHAPVLVQMTITTADDGLSRRIEPRVSPSSERFAALESLSEAGVTTGILLMPLLPFLEDNADNISAIVKRAGDAGVKCVYPGFGVTLRPGQREWFYGELDRSFPGLSGQYQRTYGERYSCHVPRVGELKAHFHRECQKRGIASHMKEIIKVYKDSAPGRQLDLFS